MAPQLGRVLFDEVGAQQIPAFAQSCLPEFVAIKPIAESGLLCGNRDRDQAPGGVGLIARGAELHQQFLTRQLHRRQLLEPRPQPLQLTPPDCPLLGDAVTALRQNVQLAFLRQELDPSLRWGRLCTPGRASCHG
jgi:hypothetical protein